MAFSLKEVKWQVEEKQKLDRIKNNLAIYKKIYGSISNCDIESK
jgi:hypothetical protein